MFTLPLFRVTNALVPVGGDVCNFICLLPASKHNTRPRLSPPPVSEARGAASTLGEPPDPLCSSPSVHDDLLPQPKGTELQVETMCGPSSHGSEAPQGHCRTGGPRKSPSSVKSRDPRALGRSAMFLTEASLFPSRRWHCFCLHVPRLLVDFKFSRAKTVSRVSFGAWLLILHATGPQRASVH